ncbi:ribonuclease HII [Bacillus sp. DJP31]|uniref:ribonuclease HII n=1 Tax=Bacillus sp. DJP31 TaxID=3409789 RepID=UPI003BB79551
MQKYSIHQIASMLEESTIDHEFIRKLKKDPRKGVLKLIEKREKQESHIKEQQTKLDEMSKYEKDLYENGFEMIAGVDEVGRGPLAGPVLAAAVILPKHFSVLGINDSKQLSHEKREEYFHLIGEQAISIGIGMIPSYQVDEVNIYEATKLAMIQAITRLDPLPHFLLIDAMKLELDIPQLSIVKGDEKSVSIAAASIVAKVVRDRYMRKLGEEYPNYGFQSHMGYGTKQHLEAISNFGIISEHRRSFSPIKEVLASS